jgi:hypothetical protein
MCEMIKIMQEYGEVTCCLGSSANLRNSCLFLQSDVRSGQDPRAVGRGEAALWWPLPTCLQVGLQGAGGISPGEEG